MKNIASTAFNFIWNIGITENVKPEETKHLRILNVGALFYGINALIWLSIQFASGSYWGWIEFFELSGIVYVIIVFFLQSRGRYTLARVVLMFGSMPILGATYVLSGPALADHYFFFTSIAFSYLLFPRTEKKLLIASVTCGLLCYLLVLYLYTVVPPSVSVSADDIQTTNTVIIYNLLILMVIFIAASRSFMSKTEDLLEKEHNKLADMTALLKKMFGRYLSTDVMNRIIEDPGGMELGGEKRTVTIMMTDLRGFTALSESLDPEQVVRMLNIYFEVMIDVILKYNGMINEIIGDALLVVFGAPKDIPYRTEAAVACAIEMQNAMAHVNQLNHSEGLPELEMGIGLNETEVVVGNIGSSKRVKYAVVGSGVNLTSRIESYTIGGQIFISKSLRDKLGDILRIDDIKEVQPKGTQNTISIYQVGGIAGRYSQALVLGEQNPIKLVLPIPFTANIIGGKNIGAHVLKGTIIRLSLKNAVARLNKNPPAMSNLKFNLLEVDQELLGRDFYGKVLKVETAAQNECWIHFTGLPLEVKAYFQSHLQHSRT